MKEEIDDPSFLLISSLNQPLNLLAQLPQTKSIQMAFESSVTTFRGERKSQVHLNTVGIKQFWKDSGKKPSTTTPGNRVTHRLAATLATPIMENFGELTASISTTNKAFDRCQRCGASSAGCNCLDSRERQRANNNSRLTTGAMQFNPVISFNPTKSRKSSVTSCALQSIERPPIVDIRIRDQGY